MLCYYSARRYTDDTVESFGNHKSFIIIQVYIIYIYFFVFQALFSTDIINLVFLFCFISDPSILFTTYLYTCTIRGIQPSSWYTVRTYIRIYYKMDINNRSRIHMTFWFRYIVFIYFFKTCIVYSYIRYVRTYVLYVSI